MDIPKRLTDKLEKDPALHGAILQSLTEFKPWFDHSKTPFFPEYTDHNWSHVIQTMATASSLIQDEAWLAVTPADATMLILAVLLHDCGMHLTEDGFLALISDGSGRYCVDGWIERTWPELWLEFLGDASRFDARKLHSVFGDAEPAHPPHSDPQHWTSRDKRLIGEFLRRHHARLAHEVALHGVPGAVPQLQLKGIQRDLADLGGLVARSHGLSIRACLPYLKKYDLRDYKGVHAVFLMAVLRVADYLQVQAERAPEQLLRVQKLRSPLSQQEWRTHEAIRDIRNTDEDPEAIYIDAAPKDVATFLKLKRLLVGIQGEIDASWAVMGEVYGRYEPLNSLGLKLRRVKSNIDDEAEFAKTVSYLPCDAAFDSAGPELLKLLIKPLYGEHPEIGIRELLQNAVDACRELKDYLDQRPEVPKPDLTSQDGDVVISLSDNADLGRWLEVSDRGIGMTAEVVRKYFLKAGASFRRSDAWRRIHETPEGKSRVLRSGRFGIGVLAAFLLGNEVEVSTRSITAEADRGLTFKATIDTEEIELRFCSRPVGTTVKVRIDEEGIWKSLSKTIHPTQEAYYRQYSPAELDKGAAAWDWYCLAYPRVVRLVGSTAPPPRLLEQRFSMAGQSATLGPKWRRIKDPNYADIQWSYWDGPFLACNGIIIEKRDPKSTYYWGNTSLLGTSGNLSLTWPHVSVFDPDGHLPLVLQRNALATQQYPFHDALHTDVIRDLMAYLLVRGPDRQFDGTGPEYRDWYPGVSNQSRGTSPSFHFCSAADGLYPSDAWHIRQGGFHKFLFVSNLGSANVNAQSLLQAGMGHRLVIPATSPSGVQQYRQWNRFALCGGYDSQFGYLREFAASCRRMLLPRDEYDFINRGGVITKYLWSDVREVSSNKQWVVLQTGNCNCGENFDLLGFSESLPTTGLPILIEWHLAASQAEAKELTPLAKLWGDLLKSPVVPYDPAERRAKLTEAFDRLGDYIAAHEQLIAEQEKAKKQKKKGSPDQSDDDEADLVP